MDIQIEKTRRILEASRGKVDFIWLGEDLGTQNAPLISMKTFTKHILPYYRTYCELAKAYDVFVMMPGGGYCFAPTHALQDNSPTENVLAMYDTAHEAGVYRTT